MGRSGRRRQDQIYILEEYRYDPRPVPIAQFNPILDPRTLRYPVRYNEEAFLEDGHVVYRSFLNGAAHDWRGVSGDGKECPRNGPCRTRSSRS